MSQKNESTVKITQIENEKIQEESQLDIEKRRIEQETRDILENARVISYGIEMKPKPVPNNMRLRPNTMAKRQRTPWSEVETHHLKRGVSQFGVGKWTKIHTAFREHFHESRRPCDLKDKYKTILNKEKVKPEPREYIQVDEFQKKINDEVYISLFPRYAAIEIAKKHGSDDDIVYVAEKDSFDEKQGIYTKSHPYLVSIIEGKLFLRRIVENKGQ
ncbi:putative Homeodomain-like, Homeodomain-related, SANT domain, DNA binding protein [Pseudoloma neurophilia]|uniref:Putative Homeodomain-like, Homeodomain-related, SANT domain, DNA binding protein n=1 Tax=Pseudoloma neurophilia TaxID=146866 RepID=A0A0R0LY20_9MICR|nr:putative Homeodomain-like, Homeodomain-related, SANT domain, DNA binding protein [Pseudoloma neurophilia]